MSHARATYKPTVNTKMPIHPQLEFFYKGIWSPACDGALVDCLIMLKDETYLSNTVFPSWFLLTASDWIKNKAGVIFSELELKDRVDLLRKRYYTFKAVLRLRGAYWHHPTKAVVAPNESWDNMLKVLYRFWLLEGRNLPLIPKALTCYNMQMNSFAGAYFYQEEPIYAGLACVFGFDDVKVKGQKEVVVISDNTEEIHEDDIITNALVDGEEEVNSPAVFPGPNVYQKLFEDDPAPNDRESGTDAGIYFIDLTSDGMMRSREKKGQIPHKPPAPSNEVVGPSTLKSLMQVRAGQTPR